MARRGGAAVLRLRRRRRCRLGFCDAGKKAADNGVASREAVAREAVPRLGSLTAQNQRDSVIRVLRRWVTPLIPDTFFCIG
jgi:hypothetical protein